VELKGNDLSNPIVGSYIGEVKTSKELGSKETCKWVWHSCQDCNKERWVRFVKGAPISNKCVVCGNLTKRRPHRKKTPIDPMELMFGRVCRICGNTYPLTTNYFLYRKDNGKFRHECKSCNNSKHGEYYKTHKEPLSVCNKKWRQGNKDKVNAASKRYRDTHKQERYDTCMNWQHNNPDKVREFGRRSTRKKRTITKGKLDHRIEVSMRQSLNGTKSRKQWQLLVGYTLDELKQHIEKQFTEGMSWGEFNKGNIHIDHIIPIKAFNFKSADDMDFRRCWALSNLQPLWKRDNLTKQAKIDKPFQPSLALGIKEKHAVYTA